jgi:hypothetical protein
VLLEPAPVHVVRLRCSHVDRLADLVAAAVRRAHDALVLTLARDKHAQRVQTRYASASRSSAQSSLSAVMRAGSRRTNAKFELRLGLGGALRLTPGPGLLSAASRGISRARRTSTARCLAASRSSRASQSSRRPCRCFASAGFFAFTSACAPLLRKPLHCPLAHSTA